LKEFQDYLPPSKEPKPKVDMSVQILRKLDRLRTIDKKQEKFVKKIEHFRSNLSLYEHLNVKPAMKHIDFEDIYQVN